MANVLVVEDSKDLQSLYEMELKEEGYRVTLASNGKEALQYAKAHRPDLVVLDILMPDMNGLEVLNRILAMDKSIPIILNSAFSGFQDNFMTWAADDYVVKSGDLTELKNAIRKLLERRRTASCIAISDENPSDT